MKKQWTSPRILVQEFEANEYVAVCWGVGCLWKDANDAEWSFKPWYLDKPNVSHAADHCGLANNQVIRDTNNDGTVDTMIEIGTDGLGELPCTIFSDPDYNNPLSVTQVQPGNKIYWTTSAADGRVWHHQGVVEPDSPAHPNRS